MDEEEQSGGSRKKRRQKKMPLSMHEAKQRHHKSVSQSKLRRKLLKKLLALEHSCDAEVLLVVRRRDVEQHRLPMLVYASDTVTPALVGSLSVLMDLPKLPDALVRSRKQKARCNDYGH